MKTLQRTIEIYSVSTETEAAELIQIEKDGAANTGEYEVTKYESKYRNKKLKGVIVEEWYVVTIQKDYGDKE